MSDEERSKGFLDRWSARKRQNKLPATDTDQQAVTTLQDPAEEPGEEITPPQSVAHQHAPDIGAQNNDQVNLPGSDHNDDELPLLTDEDMPPIESLSSDSDLSGFFSKGVTPALKRAALRHVFQQPVFNIRDGLNDYDGDYTVFEPLGDTVTSDMKWHIARKERERLEAEARELELQESLEREQLAQDEQLQKAPVADSSEEPSEQVPDAEHDDMVTAEKEALEDKAPEQAIETDNVQLPDAVESTMDIVDSQLLPRNRVAGKLERVGLSDGKNNEKKALQIADASHGHNDNAKDYEQ